MQAMLSEFIRSEQIDELLQFAALFIMIIGLFLYFLSANFINEQLETRNIDIDFFSSTISSMRQNIHRINNASPRARDSLPWRLGWLNIALNFGVYAYLYTREKKPEPWVFGSMCWRLLFCFGVTWANKNGGQLASNQLHRLITVTYCISSTLKLKIV
jgi:hypothetical protein